MGIVETAERVADAVDGWSAFGDGAVASGLIDGAGLARARRVAAESGRRLPAVLAQLGLVPERDLAEALGRHLGLPLADPARYPSEPVLPERLRPRFLRHARALPLEIAGGRLRLALVDPLDGFVIRAVELATSLPVTVEVAIPVDLEAALDRLYPEEPLAGAPPDAGEGQAGDDAERLWSLASEAPVVRLVNQIVSRAVETKASDIHIEPLEGRIRVRYRYDGVLHEAEALSASLGPAIVSRIKIMARLDIAERRLPQDGRIELAVRGQEIDFRVSTVPSLHGETVVLRILDRNAVALEYSALGLAENVVGGLRRLLDLPNGMVLVTGPTGSGKTTTLYTGLKAIDSVARNVVTVEDPIEYQIEGINQIQVKPQIGLDFAGLLRSILRQDPDVVMIGEIRDVETARIAVQAALTGHLVLSTLHTNSAAAAFTRLRDMGLEDYLLSAVLRGVVAQRLVRRLCPACRRDDPMPDELARRFGLERKGKDLRLYRAVGCPRCRHTGYSGREAIAELLVPDDEVRRLILSGGDHRAIERAAVANGMVSMLAAGVEAALDGRTTLDEVVRSLQAEG